jgi:hypothetical protein
MINRVHFILHGLHSWYTTVTNSKIGNNAYDIFLSFCITLKRNTVKTAMYLHRWWHIISALPTYNICNLELFSNIKLSPVIQLNDYFSDILKPPQFHLKWLTTWQGGFSEQTSYLTDSSLGLCSLNINHNLSNAHHHQHHHHHIVSWAIQSM